MADELGFNEEYEALRLRRDGLREQCAELLEMLAHFETTVKPAITSQYMLLVGRFEYRVYELTIEIKRWKRRFEMHRAALNRNEKPDAVAIEAALDGEFAEYAETVKKHIEEIKEADQYAHAEKLTAEESNDLRLLYHDAAKKLHPDLNPEQPESARNLWLQIQNAYNDGNWEKFKFLAGMVDGVISEEKTFEDNEHAMARLKDAIARLEEKHKALQTRLNDMKSRPPFVHEEFLDDEDKVKERQEQLSLQIKLLERRVGEYEELWKHGP